VIDIHIFNDAGFAINLIQLAAAITVLSGCLVSATPAQAASLNQAFSLMSHHFFKKCRK